MADTTASAATPTPASDEAQVPGTATPEVSTQQVPQTETPKTLTMEDVQREATRIAQSMVAKTENRINQRVQERFATLEKEKGTIGLSDAQVEQAKSRIIAEEMSRTDQTQQPQAQPPASEQAPALDQAIQYLNSQISAVFKEAGTEVTTADPEYAKVQAAIDAAWNDDNGLAKVLRAADRAAEAKAARLQQTKETAPARVLSGGGTATTGDSQPKSALDAWSNAYK